MFSSKLRYKSNSFYFIAKACLMQYLEHQPTKGVIMLVYQVLDEQNNPVAEYSDLDYALHNAQSLTFWHTDHYYHVEEINISEH
jgi:hypothetical protein